MKQFYRLFFFGCLLSCLHDSIALADYSLTLTPSNGTNLSGSPGDTLFLDLKLNIDEPNLAAVTFGINFDRATLSYIGYSNLAPLMIGNDDWHDLNHDPETSSLNYFELNLSGIYPSLGEHTLATLGFTINPSTYATATTMYFVVTAMDSADFIPISGQYPDQSNPITVSINQSTPSPVPIPSTLLLLGSGLVGLATRCRRQFSSVCS